MSRESVWNGNREDTTAVMTLDAEEPGMQTDSGEYQRVMECVPAEVPLVVPVTGESFCQCPTQTDLSSDPQLDPDSLECTCGEDESGCAWLWDEEFKSPAVLLSCCNRKVSFHPDYSCGTAAIRGSEELRHGQHFWEIKMTSPVYGTDMMVGIGTAEVNLDQFSHSFCSLLGSDAHSWGLSYTGLLHHKGLKVSFSPRFGQGSIIGLHLDTWHGTLTFYKNRRCIGVAATELRNKSFYPMVCSTAAKSSMKVISSVSAPTSLQYLCCTHLRRYLPDTPDLLTALPLPPGLKLQIRQQLGWVLRLRKPETPAHTCTQHSDHEPQPVPAPFQDPAPYLDPNSTYIPPTDTHLASNTDSASLSSADRHLASNPDSSSLTPAGTHLTSQPDSASHTPIDTHLSSHPDSASHTPADTHLSSRADSASHTPANTHLISEPDSASHTPTDTHLSSHPVSSCEDVFLYLDPDSLSEFGSCSDSASCVDPTSCPCCDAPLSFAPCFHDDSLSSASCFSGPVSRPASPLPDSTHSRPGSASGNDSDGCSSEICQRKRCRWT